MGLEEQVFAQAARIRELEEEVKGHEIANRALNSLAESQSERIGELEKLIAQLKYAGVDKPHSIRYVEPKSWTGGFPIDEEA